MWRNIIEQASDPSIVRLREKFPDQETRRRICARVAAIFLFDSKEIHTPTTQNLTQKELLSGLEESLGVHDKELLMVARALLNGFTFD